MKNEITRVYLNTWEAYNNGFLGYGWMTPEQAIDFIDDDPERDGGEWFIADIDNYLGVDFGNLDYCNVLEVLESIQELENMDEWERDEIVALIEYLNCDIQGAIDKKDRYIFYSSIDDYYDSMDELIDISGLPESLQCYFDYESYHRDCNFYIYEACNGVVLLTA